MDNTLSTASTPDKKIVWWKQGHDSYTQYYCKGKSPKGSVCEGIGLSLDAAIANLFASFDSAEMSDTN
jgi:hypothetical protein